MNSLARLFPGLEYFGPHDHDGLLVEIPEDAQSLVIMLDGPGEQILNLGGISLLGSGGSVIPMLECGANVQVSSCYDDDAAHGEESIRKGFASHSKSEENPWIRIEWKEFRPSAVLVKNRPDRFGERSRSISLHARCSGTWREIYNLRGAERSIGLLRTAGLLLGGAGVLDPVRVAIDHARPLLISALEHRFISGEMDDDEARLALAMTRIFGGAEDDDVELLSIYFAYAVSKDRQVIHLSPAWGVLNTGARIRRAESRIDELLSSRGISPGIMFSRHGLVRSKLRSMAQEYVDLASELTSVASGIGVDLMICYGTLLGAVREGAFIAHDDDMDMLFVVDEDMGSTRTRDGLIQLFRERGYQVLTKEPLLNFEVQRGEGGPSIDVFPSWRNGDAIRLYMERMAMRDIAADVMIPASMISLYGREIACPAQPHAFLLERYGEGWNRSDRFFEWPYPLVGE